MATLSSVERGWVAMVITKKDDESQNDKQCEEENKQISLGESAHYR